MASSSSTVRRIVIVPRSTLRGRRGPPGRLPYSIPRGGASAFLSLLRGKGRGCPPSRVGIGEGQAGSHLGGEVFDVFERDQTDGALIRPPAVRVEARRQHGIGDQHSVRKRAAQLVQRPR